MMIFEPKSASSFFAEGDLPAQFAQVNDSLEHINKYYNSIRKRETMSTSSAYDSPSRTIQLYRIDKNSTFLFIVSSSIRFLKQLLELLFFSRKHVWYSNF